MSLSNDPAADLVIAQKAYRDLITGQTVVSIIHEGERVDYRQGDATKLLEYITQLSQQLSSRAGRRRAPAYYGQSVFSPAPLSLMVKVLVAEAPRLSTAVIVTSKVPFGM